MGLKKRLGGVPRLRRKASQPAFVELIAPHAATLGECVIDCKRQSKHKVDRRGMLLITDAERPRPLG